LIRGRASLFIASKTVHSFKEIRFLAMRGKRECYLLIREIRVA
jgi:hypothetical protein